jgi:putative hydrolase
MKLIADLHVHSVASGHAFNTIEELARAARRKGLKYLAITDHGPDMPDGPHEYFFFNLKILPEKIHGVRILKGIEADVISKTGQLDLDDAYLRTLDIVIASCHDLVSPEKLGVDENTAMLKKVIENKYVDILGHLENPLFPVQIREIVGAAKEAGKIIEINNASFTIARKGSYNACVEIMRELRDNKMRTVINSDAHITGLVGEISAAWKVAQEVGIKREQVINFDKGLMEEFLDKKKISF